MFSDLLRRVVEEYPDPHAAWIVNVVDCAKHIFYLFVLSLCILLAVCKITTFIIWFLLKYMMNQERVYKWSVGTHTSTKTWSKTILEELMMSDKYVVRQLPSAWSSPTFGDLVCRLRIHIVPSAHQQWRKCRAVHPGQRFAIIELKALPSCFGLFIITLTPSCCSPWSTFSYHWIESCSRFRYHWI